MKSKSFILVFSLFLIDSTCGYTCDRTPKKADKPKPNINRYVIEVLGNPETYSPGQTYTVNLKSHPQNPITNTFTEFMLVVEPENPLEALQNTVSGDLRPVDDTIATFTSKCPNAITQRNTLSKSIVEITWVAPPSGNGCIAIKATVFEASDSWFTDDGELTKILCEEEENKDVQPPIFEKCCSCSEAKYEVAFQGMWTRNTHPNDYPPNMWTTKLGEVIGSSHKHSQSFWSYNNLSTDGLKLLAEDGDSSVLEDELKEKLKSEDVRTIIKARELSYPNITGTSYTVFRVDQEHHLISLVSKITPSPDWIVGVSNLELCTSECGWIQSRTLNLYPWDVGSDDGKTYNSPDLPLETPDVIKSITSSTKDYPFYSKEGEPIKAIAQLRVTRLKLYEKTCDNEEETCKLTEWSEWSTCSETCGNEVMTRDRQLVNPDEEERCTQEGTLELQETVKCEGSTSCGAPTECANAAWSDWSPCNTTCSRGYKTRYGNLTQHSNEQEEDENKEEDFTPPCVETVQCNMPECEEPTTTTSTETFIPMRDHVKIVNAGPSYGPVVDCEVSEWSEWGPCSATQPCAKGRQYRERHITVHRQNGGNACPKLREPKRCKAACSQKKKSKKGSDAINCQMGQWSNWSPCSSNCGSSAVQTRTRKILVYPRSGGNPCEDRIEERKCQLPYACGDQESRNLNKYNK